MKDEDTVKSEWALMGVRLSRAKKKQEGLEWRLTEESDPEKLLAMLKDSACLGYEMLELRGQKSALEWVLGYGEQR